MSADIEHLPLTALEVAREATSPTQLVALAIANGTPAETLARLLDVQERWQAIQAKKEFDAAMANFKSECPPALVKDSTVDFTSQKGRTHYNYADRAGITEVVTPFLSKHGLSATFETDTETPNVVKVTCEIAHKGGHSKKTSLKGPVDTSGNKNALQAIGSAVEYLSRYTFNAALGLATKGQDDDGRAAGQPIDQGYREPDAEKLYGNGGKKQAEKPTTAGGAGIWTVWRDKVLARVNTCTDGDTLQKAKEWLSTQKCPADFRAELDLAIRTKQDGLDIVATLSPQDTSAKQTPDNPDAAATIAREAEELYTMPIMALETFQAIAAWKQNTLPTIESKYQPHAERMLLIHQLPMETSTSRCLLIKELHPELTDHADRRINEIKDAMAAMQTGATA